MIEGLYEEPRFLAMGDAALLLELGTIMDRGTSERIMQIDSALKDGNVTGLVDTLPTFRSLLVRYNPLETSFDDMRATVQGFLSAPPDQTAKGRQWMMPICFDGDFAPDLDEVADRTRMSRSRVIDLFCDELYHVYMIGFLAGLPYLGDLPKALSLPRRSDPRTRLPAGSVAIALEMVVVYPLASPGGWNLIGRTPVRIFDARWDDPAVFRPGDKILFQPIDAVRYGELEEAVLNNEYRLQAVEAE